VRLSIVGKTSMACASLAAIALLALLACSEDGLQGPDGNVRVVVTLPLFKDMVEEVGGSRIHVDAIIPDGADPHTFEPVPSDVQLISDAHIIFANGLGLEEATLDLIEANLLSRAPLVELAKEAQALGREVIELSEDGERGNPHMWLDPEIGKEYASMIREELSLVDPDGVAEYGENYESYWDEIDDEEIYLTEKAAQVPEGQRVIVSTHDAFPYLARAIGYEIGAVVAGSPGQEPSPQAVAEIAQVIEDSGVNAVFREPQLGPETDVLEQAASDAGAEVCVLYSGALDDDVRSYIQIIRHNADELVDCLGG
jgi:ABC-type Zn uptake system ZnuABC Zn-binding protein ZnuA